MKKIILCIMILIVLTVSLCGCTNKQNENDYRPIDNFETIQSDGSWRVVYDKETGVMYLIIAGYRERCITPLYNADGTLKTYKQDKGE